MDQFLENKKEYERIAALGVQVCDKILENLKLI
jgi:hypothetical protein